MGVGVELDNHHKYFDIQKVSHWLSVPAQWADLDVAAVMHIKVSIQFPHSSLLWGFYIPGFQRIVLKALIIFSLFETKALPQH